MADHPATPETLRSDLLMHLARAWRAYREGRTVIAVAHLRRAARTLAALIALLDSETIESTKKGT